MLNPGDRFGDYAVVRLLGKGGMGAVYLLETAEGAQVAAKILDPGTAGDHESRKRFVREAQLALGVKHPNLVETYDVGEDPDTGLCYILMEYVPGGSLADYLKEHGALPVEDAVAVVEAMAGVLELARQKGIVHRDIKPANIMFDAEGTPKLADLGIARGGPLGTDTTTVTQTGVMIGTPAYMAPEQMLDAHNVDTRADIYSLGVVFYEMLTGERPNKDDTVVQLMAKAVKGEPLPDVRTLRPEVSASLAQLLAMMVVPDRDGRIATPGQITNALDLIARGEEFESDGTKARRKEELRVLRRQRKRRRQRVLVSVAIVVMLVALVGIGLGVAWLMRGEEASVHVEAEAPRPVRETVVVTNVVEKTPVSAAEPERAPVPIRASEPKVVERLVVVTNTVREQVRTIGKSVLRSQPEAKKPRGATDRRVRIPEFEDSRPIRRLTSADDRERECALEAARSSFGDVPATSEEVRDFMRNLRLPLVRFRPPATIGDAVVFFREAAGGRLNISLRMTLDDGAFPVLLNLTASDMRFDEALKLVCDCVDYRYDIHDNIICVHHKQTSWTWTPLPGKKSGNAADRALLETRLPEFKIMPPATVVDLIRVLRESAEGSPVNWNVRNHSGGALPQIPAIAARNVSVWNVLDMICSSVNWRFETKGDFVMLMPCDMSDKRTRLADDFDWGRYFSSAVPVGEALNKVRMRADVRDAVDKKTDKILENVKKMQTCVREMLEQDAVFSARIAMTRLESEIVRFRRLKTSPTANCRLVPWEEQSEVVGIAMGKCRLYEWLRSKIEDGPTNERLKKMAEAAEKDLESQDKRLQQLKKQAGIEF